MSCLCATPASRSTRLRTLHSAGLLCSWRWGTLRRRPGSGRARRRGRWAYRAQPREHLLREVEVLVRRNHHARLVFGIEDHRVSFCGAQLVDDLVDLLHDRTDQLGLALPHLLLQLLRAALILLFLRTNVFLACLLRLRRERYFLLVVVGDQRVERVAHALHLRAIRRHLLLELRLGRCAAGSIRQDRL